MDLSIDGQGWLDGVLQIPSPNADERPDGMAIELVVVHSISLPPGRFGGPGVTALFTNSLDADLDAYYPGIAGLRVSAHVLVRRDGRVVQFVPFGRRAWHAGVSSWQGRSRCNDFSVGIELEGCDDASFESAQYASLDRVVAMLRCAYPIAGIAGHSEIAPERKTDPGRFFDWMRLSSTAGLQRIAEQKNC